MARAGAERNRLADGFVEDGAAHGILLSEEQVSERGGDRDGVVVLRHRAAAVFHAGRDIDQQAAAEVRVLLVLLHVEAVLLGPDFPIDAAEVVARRVLAVLQELDRLPEVRAAVHAAEQPFDNVHDARISKREPIRLITSGCKDLLEAVVMDQLVFVRGGDFEEAGR